MLNARLNIKPAKQRDNRNPVFKLNYSPFESLIIPIIVANKLSEIFPHPEITRPVIVRQYIDYSPDRLIFFNVRKRL